MSLNLDKRSWQTVRFGDVIMNVTDRVDDPSTAGVDRYVGLDHLDSESLAIARWGAPTDVEAQKLRFHPGDIIFGRRRAYQKKVGYAEFEGICSAHALVLRAIPGEIEPAFLPFFIASDYFLDRAISISVGSLSPTVNWRDLKVQEFALPPLDEQRRLADLLWSAEHHRRALSGLRASSTFGLDEWASALFASVKDRATLGSLASTRSGPSFPASAVSDVPIDGALPVLGITNTKPDGTVDMSEVGYVSGLADSVGTIDEGSLVLIRTNGNRNRIGNVYLPPESAYGHAVSAFQFLMSPQDPEDRDYLYWVLKQPAMQRAMSESASGSTGLGNLAVRWLSAQLIPWPEDQGKRNEIVRLLDSAADMLRRIDAEAAAVRATIRSILQEVFG